MGGKKSKRSFQIILILKWSWQRDIHTISEIFSATIPFNENDNLWHRGAVYFNLDGWKKMWKINRVENTIKAEQFARSISRWTWGFFMNNRIPHLLIICSEAVSLAVSPRGLLITYKINSLARSVADIMRLSCSFTSCYRQEAIFPRRCFSPDVKERSSNKLARNLSSSNLANDNAISPTWLKANSASECFASVPLIPHTVRFSMTKK